jgi:alkylation response protein AidB-like acyl-CoA dehydrogenase
MRFTPTALGPGEEKLKAEVRAWLAAELPPERRISLGMAGGYDPDFSRRLADRGWVGLSIPVEYGGRGGTAVERFVVTEELLAAQAPVGAHWISDRQTAPTLVAHGTEEQRRRFLPAIARGECYFSIGMSEPEAGSDLAAVRTRAERVTGGWRLSGTKVWTTFAHRNHYFAVLCRTRPLEQSKHEGLSQLIVDLAAPGVTVRPITTLDDEEEFCEVVLDDVFVADDMVLGEEGQGWRQVTSELSLERYGPERWLSVWGLVRGLADLLGAEGNATAAEMLGRLAARYRVVRQISLAVARRVDEGAWPVTEAAVAKDLATILEQETVEAVRGLLARELDPGATDRLESLLARAVLTSPMFTLRGGTTEILRTLIAREVTR